MVVEAIQWTGENGHDVRRWADGYFAQLNDIERQHSDDPEATAEVYDELHSTWILVYTGDWIIRGMKGEFYPCRDEVFRKTYEEVQ